MFGQLRLLRLVDTDGGSSIYINEVLWILEFQQGNVLIILSIAVVEANVWLGRCRWHLRTYSVTQSGEEHVNRYYQTAIKTLDVILYRYPPSSKNKAGTSRALYPPRLSPTFANFVESAGACHVGDNSSFTFAGVVLRAK